MQRLSQPKLHAQPSDESIKAVRKQAPAKTHKSSPKQTTSKSPPKKSPAPAPQSKTQAPVNPVMKQTKPKPMVALSPKSNKAAAVSSDVQVVDIDGGEQAAQNGTTPSSGQPVSPRQGENTAQSKSTSKQATSSPPGSNRVLA